MGAVCVCVCVYVFMYMLHLIHSASFNGELTQPHSVWKNLNIVVESVKIT